MVRGHSDPLGSPFFGFVVQLLEQLRLLLLGQVAPLSHRKIVQLDIHDADSLQPVNVVSQFLAHAADLTGESLG